jgi:DNA (cytosine-5)-methyltransferase 1
MKAVELLVGAGGLALGLEKAGFSHAALLDRDPRACETLRRNARRYAKMAGGRILQRDLREFDMSELAEEDLDLLAAGTPCQPFSLAGKHTGHHDDRNLFPEVFRTIRSIRPKAVLIENVRGILRPSFRPYVDYVRDQLQIPSDQRRADETWLEHAGRVRRRLSLAKQGDVEYSVATWSLDAADYGTPQRRARVFFVAVRRDVGSPPEPPVASHSPEALAYDQWVTGEYWEKHGLPQPPTPEGLSAQLSDLAQTFRPTLGAAWRTVRDAFVGLADPPPQSPVSGMPTHHIYRAGARPYPGHTGSDIDQPAKAIKAGTHGVPGGENMLRYPQGTVRYFTVREAARLQEFPDEFEFTGSWTDCIRQIGNAAPVGLSTVIGRQIARVLNAASRRQTELTLPVPPG